MKAPVATPQAASLKALKVVDVSTRVAASSEHAGSAAVKRVLKELREVAARNPSVWLHEGHEGGIHIYPSETDLMLWRVLIEGPKGSPFEGGVFSLIVRIPAEYPFKPPSVRFETPVYHCNVNDGGGICLGILDDGWSPSLSVPKALEGVRLMLKTPDTDHALRQWIAELTLAGKKVRTPEEGPDTRYVDEARRRTRQDASRSVADFEREWGGAAA